MEKVHSLTEIQRLIPEVAELKAQIKTIRDSLRDVTEQNEDFQKLQAEIDTLAGKRAEAKALLLSDREYQKINTELDDYKFKLKDLQEILSHHLVEYYNQTQKTELTDPNGDTRQLIITAKLASGAVANPDGATA